MQIISSLTTSLWFRGAINVDITENVVPYVPVIRAEKAYQVVNGLVHLEGNISDEAQSKFHSKLHKSICPIYGKIDELVVSN